MTEISTHTHCGTNTADWECNGDVILPTGDPSIVFFSLCVSTVFSWTWLLMATLKSLFSFTASPTPWVCSAVLPVFSAACSAATLIPLGRVALLLIESISHNPLVPYTNLCSHFPPSLTGLLPEECVEQSWLCYFLYPIYVYCVCMQLDGSGSWCLSPSSDGIYTKKKPEEKRLSNILELWAPLKFAPHTTQSWES